MRYQVKDHIVREVVNSLRDTALEFHAHGSLRERLARAIEPLLVAGPETPTDPVVEANRQLLLDRSRVGVAKYGTTLESAGLSHAALTQHALEEALDLANYLQATLRKLGGGPAAKYVDTWVGTPREGQGQLGVPLSEQNARWKKVETEDLAGAVWDGPNTASQVDPCMGLPAKGRG